MPQLWIITPCYLDVPSLLILREHVLETLATTPSLGGLTPRLVVMDDTAGSDPEIAGLGALADVQVVEPPFNLGHQRGIVFALRTSAAEMDGDDLVVTLDADGQDRPEDLPAMLEPLLAPGAAVSTVVLARRTSREESLGFRAGYVGFRVAFRALTGTVIQTGNFAAFRATVVKRLLRHPYFDLCYSSTLVALNPPTVLVPCPRAPRYTGRSRMNRTRLLLHGMRMLMPFLDRIAMRALVLFSAVFAFGIAAVLAILGVKVFSDAGIPGWATSATLGVLLLSLIALASFLLLFATFSQSRGVSLAHLEDDIDRSRRA